MTHDRNQRLRAKREIIDTQKQNGGPEPLSRNPLFYLNVILTIKLIIYIEATLNKQSNLDHSLHKSLIRKDLMAVQGTYSALSQG
jgi:hypothetical protein